MREVTREEFHAFLMKHRYLERNVNRIVEPAVLEYYDFRDGQVWPNGLVAYIKTDYYTGLPVEYWIS